MRHHQSGGVAEPWCARSISRSTAPDRNFPPKGFVERADCFIQRRPNHHIQRPELSDRRQPTRTFQLKVAWHEARLLITLPSEIGKQIKLRPNPSTNSIREVPSPILRPLCAKSSRSGRSRTFPRVTYFIAGGFLRCAQPGTVRTKSQARTQRKEMDLHFEAPCGHSQQSLPLGGTEHHLDVDQAEAVAATSFLAMPVVNS